MAGCACAFESRAQQSQCPLMSSDEYQYNSVSEEEDDVEDLWEDSDFEQEAPAKKKKKLNNRQPAKVKNKAKPKGKTNTKSKKNTSTAKRKGGLTDEELVLKYMQEVRCSLVVTDLQAKSTLQSSECVR